LEYWIHLLLFFENSLCVNIILVSWYYHDVLVAENV
jgi:hypothetical protein